MSSNKHSDFPGIHVTGAGPAVVMLHSSLSSSKQWLPLIAELKQHFTFINIDILGYGSAPKVTHEKDYNFDVEVARIKRAIEHYLGEQAYHLVGHSCGGAIALKLAVEAPSRLLSMALYEPVAFHLLPQGSEERLASESFGAKVTGASAREAATIFTDFWNKPGFFTGLPQRMQEAMAADMNKVTLDFKGLISEQYTLSDLTQITCPAMMLCGQHSPQLSAYLAKSITEHIGDCHFELMDAGHMGPVSHAALVQGRIAKFLLS